MNGIQIIPVIRYAMSMAQFIFSLISKPVPFPLGLLLGKRIGLCNAVNLSNMPLQLPILELGLAFHEHTCVV
jgi:hypothetical protein